MFDNIGGKIKRLAVILTVLGVIASVIAGIVTISSGSNYARYYGNNHMTIIGLLTIVLGSLASWIGSFLLYGFGQLIEHAQSIDSKLSALNVRDYLGTQR